MCHGAGSGRLHNMCVCVRARARVVVLQIRQSEQ
eukprot:COSAG01_NODE_68043_length_265_cov_0.626506_1_plen_33_part_10